MRYLLIALTLLFSLNGCQDKKNTEEAQAKHDAQIAKQVRAEVLAEFETKKKQEAEEEKKLQTQKTAEAKPSFDPKNVPLNQMGVHVEESSITIDTNKTKTFLNDLSKKLEMHIKKISDDLEKGIVDAKEAGVEINKEHINIDLNKTQDMLEAWGKKIQVFVDEFDKVSQSDQNENNNSK